MSDKSIRAVGVVTVKDVAAFMPHMEAVTKETRKEAGCIETNAYREVGKENDNKIYVVGLYKDQEALDGHLETQHVKDFREKTKDMVVSLEITKLRKIDI